MKFDLSTYISPLTINYGSIEMRRIFSEEYKYRLWRKIWVALAEVQHEAGLISNAELDDLKAHEHELDIARLKKIEVDTKHDIAAAIKEYGEKATLGGGKIHLGATSLDIGDNAEMMRIREAFQLIKTKTKIILHEYVKKIEEHAHLSCMAYTHLQPAEPTTLGYRFAYYAQDLLIDYSMLQYIEKEVLKGKGFKGAVGTSASFVELLKGKEMTASEMEERLLSKLGIEAYTISSQIYPRKADYMLLSTLASIASSVAKFAEDLRILQSASIGELSEPFGSKQVGSSAMPFKKNPIACERICSLARFVMNMPHLALENATLSHLERTHDDLANRRLAFAHGFILVDDILIEAEKIISNLVVNKKKIAQNVALFAPFAATERVMIEAVKMGADRQKIHEELRNISMIAWSDVQEGKPNSLVTLLKENRCINKYLEEGQIEELLDVSAHIGDAPERALKLASHIRALL